MHDAKVWSSVLNRPFTVDCDVYFVCEWILDDDNCVYVCCWDI